MNLFCSFSFHLFYWCCLLILIPNKISAHSKDDPILTLVRSQHVNSESTWMELSLDQVPRYLAPKQVIFHTLIPQYDPNITTDYRINPNHDLKVSFLFDHYQNLATPWITVYDSVGRRSLRKLEITFIHDEYEIVKIIYNPTYGNKLSKIEPTHPTLRGFELIYSWENVQEEDVAVGIQVLFLSVLIGVLGIVGCMMFSIELDYQPLVSSPPNSGSSQADRPNSMNSPSISRSSSGSKKYRR